ncbi:MULTISPECIES: excinuclease ABC subunit UvrA [Butyricimonas]|uniref:excinuclease ABC subunit UvrA n=1 Tax=Butyricimonas TaxID=574697 RepID=UPI001D05F0B8|nr:MULTISPECIES: excinuclease ABC subunit UvrA [Butyricimonas]MCB6970878.1 excinuclease ABC subunit UvrA [Butyricimonas synergistica]MCG4517592.1 excinuclease ABC subunit UvrA [Butyricimonas sp. DFI.6.44]
MSKQRIELKGIRVHNLKNIDLDIKLNQLVVITGVSGSGKSSLAFDTLYAEGQRRYVESLSSYARQFLGRLNKPECDYIKGIPPAVAIEQKVNTSNPRSTVGTSTELYDYIKLLYARMGKTFSPVSGEEVKRHSVDDISQYILDQDMEQTVIIMAKSKDMTDDGLPLLVSQGFSRIKYGDEFIRISDLIDKNESLDPGKEIFLVIDRLRINHEKDTVSRIKDSIETALYEGNGTCYVEIDGKIKSFSNKFEADGITFQIPTINTFSFNSPIGACPRCEGYGKILGIDEDLVVPNKSLSVYDDAVMCWRGEKMSEWKHYFIKNAHKVNFPVHTPYYELTEKEKDTLWNNESGIYAFFEYLESKKFKIQNRVMIARYTGKTKCPVCHGTRLKKEVTYVKINGRAITELVDMPITELKTFFDSLVLSEHDQVIAARVLPDIHNRINFLLDVGLGYLTLNRLSSSLSGGESQRINLATSLGSALVGSLYILDEPSIGLHSRDTDRLINVLHRLRDLGNTVVVVEHDEDIIKSADEIIDVGPLAGRLGGEIIFQGSLKELKKANTLTSDYIYGKKTIPVPAVRKKSERKIVLTGATENNLKNIDVTIPLGVMTAVTGVSGSGKSTLIKTILVPALKKYYGDYSDRTGSFNKLSGDIDMIRGVEFIDQNPIGKSSRSNPVTYLKAWDDIRKIYADEKLSKLNGFKPAHFSFNVPGGRCEECQGEGIIKVEMQFMADVYLECEHCKGKRFKDEVLEIKYKDKNIYDILEMTVNQAVEFFSSGTSHSERSIVAKLQKLVDVGLGYIKLGQASSTLSGGESQRVKLAYHLSQENAAPTLFVFDEPTTGLHFHDIHKLMDSLNALIDRGHTVLIIEHNMDVIKCADNIIDLGPEGGSEGGYLVFEGTPEELVKCQNSYTGKYLAEKLQEK